MRVCNRCVMDETAENITFFNDGCSFCKGFIAKEASRSGRQDLQQRFLSDVKACGKGKKYDCIIGVSGGVDSAYALHLAIENGLRPLAVHMDNGWNSNLAQENIENLINKTGVDFQTNVLNWLTYKRLMQSFFDADVIDIELLYDNAMRAVNWRAAAKYGVKYILSGVNTSTEGMSMPQGWNWNKTDKYNMVRISRRFSGTGLETFPALSTIEYAWHLLRGRRWIPFLDYFEYDKEKATKLLIEKYGYRPYPYKHYESIFTRFYQGHLLPEKFNVDKRKLHLSNLIVTGQMDRTEAEAKVAENPYNSRVELVHDTDYFLKKMGWKAEALEEYLKRPPISHAKYGSEAFIYPIIQVLRKYVVK